MLDDGRMTTFFDDDGAHTLGPDPLAALDDLCAHVGLDPTTAPTPGLPPFSGGLIGAVAYDLGRRVESVGLRARRDRPHGDLALWFAEHVVAVGPDGDALLIERVLPTPGADTTRRTERRRARTLRTLGQQITGAIRTVDRGAHIDDGRHHRFALILPETPAEGAEVFAHRFRGRLVELLSDRRIPVEERDVGLTSITVPGGESELAELREQARALVGPEPVRATD